MGRLLVLIVVFAVFLFIVATMSRPEHKLDLEFAASWSMKTLGSLIAVIAAAGLVLQAFAAAPTMGKLSPFTFGLLGGLVLVNPHWSVLVAFTVLCVAVVVKEMVAGRPGARHELEGTA